MMNNKRMKLTSVICGVVLTAAVITAAGSIVTVMGDNYENASEYTQGEADISSEVKNLDINWTSGKIEIAYHNNNTVLLRETANKSISSDMEMRWWLDGDTLRVQYSQSGAGFFNFGFQNLQKELTVTLPEGISLEDVSIRATSADVEIPSLKAEAVKMASTSGDINASADAPVIEVEATSGNIGCKTGESADEVSVVTTSGGISLEAGDAGSAKVRSTSGNVYVKGGSVKSMQAGSTSGNVKFELQESGDTEISSTSGDIEVRIGALNSLKVHATSGDVTAYLPEQPGFTADIHTTSGDVRSALPMSSEGSTYVCGDGSGRVEIHTTSGEVVVDRAE